jgi:hypothetical protein
MSRRTLHDPNRDLAFVLVRKIANLGPLTMPELFRLGTRLLGVTEARVRQAAAWAVNERLLSDRGPGGFELLPRGETFSARHRGEGCRCEVCS